MTLYKQQHEQFISGHNGTTYLETALVTSIPCVANFARDLLVLSDIGHFLTRFSYLRDMLMLVLPNILAVTVLSDHIEQVLLVLTLVCLVLALTIALKTDQRRNTEFTSKHHLVSSQKHFITSFKSTVIICTSIAILAVDFPVFPRRFAKCESYGFGGMDVGVGLFVIANAIVSREARGHCSILPVSSQLRQAIISSLPLVVLGFARLLSVKGVEYQEHVTEYGVHWNFFFTLSILKVLLTLAYCVISVKHSLVGALCIILLHQYCLTRGLSSYIISDTVGRTGFLEANREGILSLPGYVAIYLFSVELGVAFFKSRNTFSDQRSLAQQLCLRFIVCTLLMEVCHSRVEPVSRRLANAAFVFWVMSVGTLMLLLCLIADICVLYLTSSDRPAHITASKSNSLSSKATSSSSGIRTHSPEVTPHSSDIHRHKPEVTSGSSESQKLGRHSNSCLLQAVSFNSLLFFLLANVLTGAVNMSVATLYVQDLTAVLTLTGYMFVLGAVITLLHRCNVRTKLW